MLKPLTERQATMIVNNVVKACTDDIGKLSPAGYKFLYLASGFIAHYDRQGFIYYYYTGDNLRADILRNKAQNQWRNFTPNDRDYAYMMQKRDIYNAICQKLAA